MSISQERGKRTFGLSVPVEAVFWAKLGRARSRVMAAPRNFLMSVCLGCPDGGMPNLLLFDKSWIWGDGVRKVAFELDHQTAIFSCGYGIASRREYDARVISCRGIITEWLR